MTAKKAAPPPMPKSWLGRRILIQIVSSDTLRGLKVICHDFAEAWAAIKWRQAKRELWIGFISLIIGAAVLCPLIHYGPTAASFVYKTTKQNFQYVGGLVTLEARLASANSKLNWTEINLQMAQQALAKKTEEAAINDQEARAAHKSEAELRGSLSAKNESLAAEKKATAGREEEVKQANLKAQQRVEEAQAEAKQKIGELEKIVADAKLEFDSVKKRAEAAEAEAKKVPDEALAKATVEVNREVVSLKEKLQRSEDDLRHERLQHLADVKELLKGY